MKLQKERFGKETKQFLISKKKEKVYKAELIEAIPESEDVSIYFHGRLA